MNKIQKVATILHLWMWAAVKRPEFSKFEFFITSPIMLSVGFQLFSPYVYGDDVFVIRLAVRKVQVNHFAPYDVAQDYARIHGVDIDDLIDDVPF